MPPSPEKALLRTGSGSWGAASSPDLRAPGRERPPSHRSGHERADGRYVDHVVGRTAAGQVAEGLVQALDDRARRPRRRPGARSACSRCCRRRGPGRRGRWPCRRPRLPLNFRSPMAGTRAASACISPSRRSLGAFSLAIFDRAHDLVHVGVGGRALRREREHGDPGLLAGHGLEVLGRGDGDVRELGVGRIGDDGAVGEAEQPSGEDHDEVARNRGDAGSRSDGVDGRPDDVAGRGEVPADDRADLIRGQHQPGEVEGRSSRLRRPVPWSSPWLFSFRRGEGRARPSRPTCRDRRSRCRPGRASRRPRRSCRMASGFPTSRGTAIFSALRVSAAWTVRTSSASGKATRRCLAAALVLMSWMKVFRSWSAGLLTTFSRRS